MSFYIAVIKLYPMLENKHHYALLQRVTNRHCSVASLSLCQLATMMTYFALSDDLLLSFISHMDKKIKLVRLNVRQLADQILLVRHKHRVGSVVHGVSIRLLCLHTALLLFILNARAVSDLGLRHQTDDLVGIYLEDVNHLNA